MDMPKPTPDANGWITMPCGARSGGPYWNRIQLPPDWIEVQVYISSILWHDGNNVVTNLNAHGIWYNGTDTPGNNNHLTSTDPDNPQLITVLQPPGHFYTAVDDDPVNDNYGGYILMLRKKPGS